MEMDAVRHVFGGRIGQGQAVGDAARNGRLLRRKRDAIDQFITGESVLLNVGIEHVVRTRQGLREAVFRREMSVSAAFGRGERNIVQLFRRCVKGIHLEGIVS